MFDAQILSAPVDAPILALIPPSDATNPSRNCSSCGRPGHDRRSCGRVVKVPRPFDPWADLEWEEHKEAMKIVADNPDGMTLEEVGAHLGITRERVRQIEAAALRKLHGHEVGFDTVPMGRFVFALVDCEKCDDPFVREGRRKCCYRCEPPPKPSPVKRAKPRLKLSFNLAGWFSG